MMSPKTKDIILNELERIMPNITKVSVITLKHEDIIQYCFLCCNLHSYKCEMQCKLRKHNTIHLPTNILNNASIFNMKGDKLKFHRPSSQSKDSRYYR